MHCIVELRAGSPNAHRHLAVVPPARNRANGCLNDSDRRQNDQQESLWQVVRAHGHAALPTLAGGVRLEMLLLWTRVRRETNMRVVTPFDPQPEFPSDATGGRADPGCSAGQRTAASALNAY